MVFQNLKVWKQNLDTFILDDYDTKKQKIKNYIYQNRNLLYSLTIIGIVLAILTTELEKTCKCTSPRNLKGGATNTNTISSTITGIFGKIGTFFGNQLLFIFNFFVTLLLIGLLIFVPVLAYLLVVYLMVKFLIRGGMKI